MKYVFLTLFAVAAVFLGAYLWLINTSRSDAVDLLIAHYVSAGKPLPTTDGCPFTDIAGDPHEEEICQAWALKITVGTSATTFSPSEKTPLWQWAILWGKTRLAILSN